MQIEIFDAISPSRALLFHTSSQALAVIVDGSSSWGSGREAADRARELLTERWQAATAWSPTTLRDDITTVANSTPSELRDREFGWSFSVTSVLCTGNLLQCVAAGFYRVDVLAQSGTRTLFRPAMLVDDLLENGTLTAQTLNQFEHRNVCLGPFVGDNDQVSLTDALHDLVSDEVVIVTHAARFDLSKLPIPESAAALAALASPDTSPSPVIVVKL